MLSKKAFTTALCTVFALALAACNSGSGGTGGGGGRGGDDPGGYSDSEICDDGQDNDGNGSVDEGCGCNVGEQKACWPGRPDERGVGACTDGRMTCEANDEFTRWTACEGAVLPSEDPPGDGIDQDCRGEDGPEDPGGAGCSSNEYGEGCFNGRDEDCDGLVDCDDPDCEAKCAACVEVETCGDGIDNDCDASTDCADVDCAGSTGCGSGGGTGGGGGGTGGGGGGTGGGGGGSGGGGGGGACIPEACWDDYDNDCDGRTDCEDTDCEFSDECGCTEVCVPSQQRWCDTPINCAWGQQVCNPDGSWGVCSEVGAAVRPPGCEDSRLYDPTCCSAAANECCQDYPSDGSIGECTGITACE